MFDLDEAPRNERRPRSCWHESALLSRMINALPCLQHISFFADASDDSTLSLLFASIIDHPSRHARPQPDDEAYEMQPIAARLKSFGWRQRAAPPSGFRTFSQTSTFVSTMHVLRHAHNLSFLVLDADMDEMGSSDILSAVRELAKREAPLGQEPAKVSLMLCGPIAGWEDGFLDQLVDTFRDIRELFLDRPLKKLIRAGDDDNEFVSGKCPCTQLTPGQCPRTLAGAAIPAAYPGRLVHVQPRDPAGYCASTSAHVPFARGHWLTGLRRRYDMVGCVARRR